MVTQISVICSHTPFSHCESSVLLTLILILISLQLFYLLNVSQNFIEKEFDQNKIRAMDLMNGINWFVSQKCRYYV